MSIPELLFSFRGRVSRRTFWLWNAFYFLMIISVATLVKKLFPESDNMVLPTILVLLVIPDLAITAKRWHDRNKSLYWLGLHVPLVLTRFMVPLAGVENVFQPTMFQSAMSLSAMACGAWIFAECGLFEGDQKENQYGPCPTR
ncbi:DUF805 domain-containing protein [Vibrio sp. DW001]|uniref:DUF805 domain-containing protein n=1 Tax=Vibrio sp. DW001 TaxID=2912315 RepID=UPI0023B0EFF6|nr:DUF805 domain-containing protein [Vibrio sp. DW001]WED26514.1 DUF805 domain-containing protein [Vibrio sp. DW001]